jgi:hypothetical protein
MHVAGFIIRNCHDARSPERKKNTYLLHAACAWRTSKYYLRSEVSSTTVSGFLKVELLQCQVLIT